MSALCEIVCGFLFYVHFAGAQHAGPPTNTQLMRNRKVQERPVAWEASPNPKMRRPFAKNAPSCRNELLELLDDGRREADQRSVVGARRGLWDTAGRKEEGSCMDTGVGLGGTKGSERTFESGDPEGAMRRGRIKRGEWADRGWRGGVGPARGEARMTSVGPDLTDSLQMFLEAEELSVRDDMSAATATSLLSKGETNSPGSHSLTNSRRHHISDLARKDGAPSHKGQKDARAGRARPNGLTQGAAARSNGVPQGGVRLDGMLRRDVRQDAVPPGCLSQGESLPHTQHCQEGGGSLHERGRGRNFPSLSRSPKSPALERLESEESQLQRSIDKLEARLKVRPVPL